MTLDFLLVVNLKMDVLKAETLEHPGTPEIIKTCKD